MAEVPDPTAPAGDRPRTPPAAGVRRLLPEALVARVLRRLTGRSAPVAARQNGAAGAQPVPPAPPDAAPPPPAVPRAPHLSPEELETFRERLQAERRRLLTDARQMDEAIHGTWIRGREASDAVESADETASNNMAYHLAEALGGVERQTLREIDAALERIARGTYGWCEECGAPIPHGRLEAKLFARLCIRCREKLEARRP